MTVIKGSDLSSINKDLLMDESNMPDSWCEIAYIPENSEDIGEAINICAGKSIPYTISSARTGLVGGALPFGGALISFSKLEKILEFYEDKGRKFFRVSSSVTLDELQSAGLEKGVYFPPNPTESTASMGGIIATDASGSRSFRYGSARNFVYGLKGFFFDGTPFDIKRGQYLMTDDHGLKVPGLGGLKLSGDFPKKMRKNSVGYNLWKNMDLVDIICGNEGSLAVITEADVLMKKIPDSVFSGMFFFEGSENILQFIETFEENFPHTLRSVEYLDGNSVGFLKDFYSDKGEIVSYLPDEKCEILFADFEFADQKEDMFYEKLEETVKSSGIDMEKVFGGDTKKEAEIVTNIRHSLPEAVNHRIKEIKREYPKLHKVASDMAVPVDKTRILFDLFKNSLGRSGLQYVVFGHIGDGHPHVNVIPKNYDELNIAKKIYAEIAVEVVKMGGTLSAEHGLGKLKKEYMKVMYDDNILGEMLRIKRFFDPENILGPGILFD